MSTHEKSGKNWRRSISSEKGNKVLVNRPFFCKWKNELEKIYCYFPDIFDLGSGFNSNVRKWNGCHYNCIDCWFTMFVANVVNVLPPKISHSLRIRSNGPAQSEKRKKAGKRKQAGEKVKHGNQILDALLSIMRKPSAPPPWEGLTIRECGRESCQRFCGTEVVRCISMLIPLWEVVGKFSPNAVFIPHSCHGCPLNRSRHFLVWRSSHSNEGAMAEWISNLMQNITHRNSDTSK